MQACPLATFAGKWKTNCDPHHLRNSAFADALSVRLYTMQNSSRSRFIDLSSAVARYTFVSMALHLVWEVLQLPLYTLWTTGTPSAIAFAVLHCTIGDALIAAVSLTVSVLILWAMDWPKGKFRQVAAATFLMGLGYTIYSEWHNTTVTLSWAYSPAMPTLFGIGLSPVVQWIVIPVIALWWVFRRTRASCSH